MPLFDLGASAGWGATGITSAGLADSAGWGAAGFASAGFADLSTGGSEGLPSGPIKFFSAGCVPAGWAAFSGFFSLGLVSDTMGLAANPILTNLLSLLLKSFSSVPSTSSRSLLEVSMMKF